MLGVVALSLCCFWQLPSASRCTCHQAKVAVAVAATCCECKNITISLPNGWANDLFTLFYITASPIKWPAYRLVSLLLQLLQAKRKNYRQRMVSQLGISSYMLCGLFISCPSRQPLDVCLSASLVWLVWHANGIVTCSLQPAAFTLEMRRLSALSYNVIYEERGRNNLKQSWGIRCN